MPTDRTWNQKLPWSIIYNFDGPDEPSTVVSFPDLESAKGSITDILRHCKERGWGIFISDPVRTETLDI